MDDKAPEFWRDHGEMIRNLCRATGRLGDDQ